MANTIIHKLNSTSGAVPTSSDLSPGELAVNDADGKIFLKKSDDTIVELSGGTQDNGSGSSEIRLFLYISDEDQTIFSGEDEFSNVLDLEGRYVSVYVDGLLCNPTSYVFDNDSVTFSDDNAVSKDLEVIIINFLMSGPGIMTKTDLPPASLSLFNSIVFEVGDKPYICTANSSTPSSDDDCFWVALT